MTFALTKLARQVRPEPGAGRDRVLNYLPPHVPRPPDLPNDVFGHRYPHWPTMLPCSRALPPRQSVCGRCVGR